MPVSHLLEDFSEECELAVGRPSFGQSGAVTFVWRAALEGQERESGDCRACDNAHRNGQSRDSIVVQ
ncbi:hypothetical protein [Rhizobium bangladeshense]|uniref:hypothetical protein n=1 Tax=Rhizobium bangladeshense TaxID=1138189 RepID=UPI001C83BB3E|nr:hypothetical protein [Rhizobium bangladeshense]MBX4892856.1 hypothetical protein [Rhizobium bangladeshense]MBX4918265.1 hypothetical protein [Rhizobium bangladeshense]